MVNDMRGPTIKKIIGINFIFIGFAFADTGAPRLLKNEVDMQFVARVTNSNVHMPDSTPPQISRTKKLIKGKESLVGFTETLNEVMGSGLYDLSLNLFVLDKGESYQWYKTEACQIEGGSPTLKSFFFANADSDTDLEIGVICEWRAAHQSECPMPDELKFFKIRQNQSAVELGQLENSKFASFYGEAASQVNKNMKCRIPKFKTAADVKKMLLNLGFK